MTSYKIALIVTVVNTVNTFMKSNRVLCNRIATTNSTYPDLYIDNPWDSGKGRIIPTTSCDELFAELALWMGASTGDLYNVLPNIGNFWTPTPSEMPLGMFTV